MSLSEHSPWDRCLNYGLTQMINAGSFLLYYLLILAGLQTWVKIVLRNAPHLFIKYLNLSMVQSIVVTKIVFIKQFHAQK